MRPKPAPDSPTRRWLLACLSLGALLGLAGAADQRQPWPNQAEDPTVTPIAGPSWLTHLGITLDKTSLGQSSGVYGPGDNTTAPPQESLGVPRSITIGGADLYRFNCQACHRAEGTGKPPEISSVLDAVQGSSMELVRKRLREEHQRSAEKTARAEAVQARAAILTRIHQGGKRMPPRDYLRDEDVLALFAYLTELAGTPNGERPSTEVVTWARVGEQIAKGTCHICHDAVGPHPTAAALSRGAIPSLQSLLARKAVTEFVRKVRSGAPVALVDPALFHRGRMPVFTYLKEAEVAATYMYLSTYPPRAR
jgi:mono/diheme cytochrome c family protein